MSSEHMCVSSISLFYLLHDVHDAAVLRDGRLPQGLGERLQALHDLLRFGDLGVRAEAGRRLRDAAVLERAQAAQVAAAAAGRRNGGGGGGRAGFGALEKEERKKKMVIEISRYLAFIRAS